MSRHSSGVVWWVGLRGRYHSVWYIPRERRRCHQGSVKSRGRKVVGSEIQGSANQFGKLLNLGRVDPKGSSDYIDGQTKDCWIEGRVSNASRRRLRAIRGAGGG